MKFAVGFRGRLITATTLLTLFTLGVAFGVIYVLVNREQQHQLDQALLAEATEEVRELAAHGADTIVISDRPGPDANDVGPLPKYAAVHRGRELLTATANWAAQSDQFALDDRPHGLGFDLWHGSEHLRAIRLPVPAHQGTTLLLAVPRKDLDGDAAFLRRAMSFVLLIAVAWTVFLTFGVINRLTRIQQRITAVVRRVSVGDLEARVSAGTAADELTELGRNVDEMIERLSVLLKSQQQFIANAAHELRSPLAALYGELSHALRRSRTADEYRRIIEEGLDSTRRLKTLADDLLALARLGAGPVRGNEEVGLASVLAEAATAVEPDRATRRIELRFVDVDRVVRGHTSDLTRLFRNLLENAIRHAPAGTPVEVRARVDDGNAVTIAVHDQGQGVPVEDGDRIFEPFFRGSRERATEQPGAGLGLAIARNIARLHGGDLTLASPGRDGGSEFVVRLPAAGVTVHETAPLSAQAPEAQT